MSTDFWAAIPSVEVMKASTARGVNYKSSTGSPLVPYKNSRRRERTFPRWGGPHTGKCRQQQVLEWQCKPAALHQELVSLLGWLSTSCAESRRSGVRLAETLGGSQENERSSEGAQRCTRQATHRSVVSDAATLVVRMGRDPPLQSLSTLLRMRCCRVLSFPWI